ncbi:MAG: putative metallopeptidase [Nitrososphaerota archaeon]
MKVKYSPAPDLEERIKKIVKILNLSYIDPERVRCVRSYGSSSRSIYARIHGVSRAFLVGVGIKPHYVVEFVSENFDKLPEDEKDKVLIHELLHIPKTFSGGLLSHRRANIEREVKILYKILREYEERNRLSKKS